MNGYGQSFRAKGNLFDVFSYVKFHNSEFGYVGRDKSSIEANAYKSMKFSRTHGAGLVWVTDGELCSSEMVWVQKKPKLVYKSNAYSPYDNAARVNIGWFVDKYSKAAKDPNTKARIWLNATHNGISSSSSVPLTQLTGSTNITVNTSTSGWHSISLEISDGTYREKIHLNNLYIPGETL